MEFQLTESEAFVAMSMFVADWARGGMDATIDILATDLMLDSVGNRPSDLAVWDDWISCVAKVKAGGDTPLRWSAVE